MMETGSMLAGHGSKSLTLKALVVDDELGMRLAVERVLSGYRVFAPEWGFEVGFEVDSAETGEEALEKIAATNPDLLLLDLKLPRASGLDVLSRVMEDERDMLTIMITAYASIETAVSATRRGAFDLLPKPFSPNELKASVYKAAKHLLVSRRARELEKERRLFRYQMISMVAHELKSPIAAVEQYLCILGDGTLEDDPARAKELVERSVARIRGMRKLILDLLDVTGIECGRYPRDPREQDLVPIVREALESFREEAEKRGIKLELSAPDELVFQADRREIETIARNLVSNAVKYNVDGGRVEASMQEQDDRMVLTVSDSGLGMTPEESSGLFQDFYRVKNDRTREIEGTGLGLSIVSRLSSLYGGKVEVKSTPGQGSSFTVTLFKGAQNARA